MINTFMVFLEDFTNWIDSTSQVGVIYLDFMKYLINDYSLHLNVLVMYKKVYWIEHWPLNRQQSARKVCSLDNVG